MKIKTIYYSSLFVKKFKKIPKRIQKQAVKKEALFKSDPFSPSLKTHRLKGELNEYWAFSINYSYRVMFEFIDDKTVGFVNIGTHEIYK